MLAVVLALTFAVFTISTIQLATIPNKYLLIALPIYGIVTAVCVWLLFDTKKLKNRKVTLVILSALAILLSVINIYATSVVYSAGSLLNNVQDKQSHYVEYSIVTNSTKDIQVDSAGDIAIISTDLLYDKASASAGPRSSSNAKTYRAPCWDKKRPR